MAVTMTDSEALTTVFEAAEYALENDYEYIEKDTERAWVKALRSLRKRKIIIVSAGEQELIRQSLYNESGRRHKASRSRSLAGPQFASIRANLRRQSDDCLALANSITTI